MDAGTGLTAAGDERLDPLPAATAGVSITNTGDGNVVVVGDGNQIVRIERASPAGGPLRAIAEVIAQLTVGAAGSGLWEGVYALASTLVGQPPRSAGLAHYSGRTSI